MNHTRTETEFIHIVDHLQYPTSKDGIVDALRTEGTGNGVVDIGKRLPDKRYANAGEVKRAAGIPD